MPVQKKKKKNLAAVPFLILQCPSVKWKQKLKAKWFQVRSGSFFFFLGVSCTSWVMTSKSAKAYTYPINLCCAILACECIFPSCGVFHYKWPQPPAPNYHMTVWSRRSTALFSRGTAHPVSNKKRIKEIGNSPLNWWPFDFIQCLLDKNRCDKYCVTAVIQCIVSLS